MPLPLQALPVRNECRTRLHPRTYQSAFGASPGQNRPVKRCRLGQVAAISVRCPSCGFINYPNARFCVECDNPLSQRETGISPSSVSSVPSLQSSKVRMGYVVSGGLTAAIFSGLFYWAINYTYTEEVWRDLGYGYGFWVPVTRTIDPAIQALCLVAAIIGLVAMVYGVVSRK